MKSPLYLDSGYRARKDALPYSREMRTSTLELWKGKVDEQSSCTFLTKLPAEIRNEIYEYIFGCSETSREMVPTEEEQKNIRDHGNRSSIQRRRPNIPSLRPHPLSLLLSCRKINLEATLLAFSLHSFTIRSTITFHSLRQRTSTLSTAQIQAIKSLTFHLHDWTASPLTTSDFITNAILMFPHANHLEIKLQPSTRQDHFPPGVADSFCGNHVPSWFTSALYTTLQGRSYKWQTGEKWTCRFPKPHASGDGSEWLHTEPRNQTCDGKCTAVLTQEGTGRQVRVRLRYIRKAHPRLRPIRLEADTLNRLPVTMVDTVSGLGGVVYEPGEDYWVGLRARRPEESGGKGVLGVLGVKVSIPETVAYAWRGSVAQVLWDGMGLRKVTRLDERI